jgi:hypothetical protein
MSYLPHRLFRHKRTMIVTVVAMFMMQLTMIQIIDMISMRNLLVPAINMIAGALHRRTGSRMLLTDSDHMIIIMLFMREVQMPTMQVISMPLVFDGDMPTISTVRMDMFCMNDMCHSSFPFQGSAT